MKFEAISNPVQIQTKSSTIKVGGRKVGQKD